MGRAGVSQLEKSTGCGGKARAVAMAPSLAMAVVDLLGFRAAILADACARGAGCVDSNAAGAAARAAAVVARCSCREQADLAKSRGSPSAPEPTGFLLLGPAASEALGAPAAPLTFGFGAAACSTAARGAFGGAGPLPAPPGASPFGAVAFGFGSTVATAAFASTGSLFGSLDSAFAAPVEVPAVAQEKKLAQLPDFGRAGEVPLGNVFVHGSGECDQLGLGDEVRERRKPTIVRGLVSVRV